MSNNHRQHRMPVTHAIIKIVVDRNKSMGGAQVLHMQVK